MIVDRYYAICVRVPSGYPDVVCIYAENEEEFRNTPFHSFGLALIGVIRAK